jgi:hypothetical protein
MEKNNKVRVESNKMEIKEQYIRSVKQRVGSLE